MADVFPCSLACLGEHRPGVFTRGGELSSWWIVLAYDPFIDLVESKDCVN